VTDRRWRTCRYPLDPLAEVMERLLGPGGCPWDREQDHRSLRPYVIEEAYEVVAAIDEGDPAKLCEELGDLLLQVVFHASLARHDGRFDLNDVVAGITQKLIRRHPHVFGESRVSSARAVLRQWEDIKKAEAGESGAPPRLETHLPALMQAQKLLERAARVGRPLETAVSSDVAPALTPDAPRDRERAFGERLLGLLEEARRAGVDAELALRCVATDLARRLEDTSGPAEPGGAGPAHED